MHPRSLIPMLAVVASCSASATPPRDTRAADEAAIEAAMKDYTAAILANDAAKVASWWTEDARYMRANFANGCAIATAASVEKDDLAVSGDLAYFIGRYHEVLQPRQGAAVEDAGRFVFIWKRQSDGTWKIARSVGTDLAKAAGVAPAAQKDSSKKSG